MLRIGLSRLLLVSSFVSLLALSGCGGGSSTKTTPPPSTPQNPTPSVTSITPGSLVAGSASQTITVSGSGFVSTSVINVNATSLATTYVSGTSLQGTIPASAIAADGTVKVTVTNPAPGGGTSQVENYAITVLTATVTGLSPQTVPQGLAAVVTISGAGFDANSVAQWNGSARPTTFVNATTLQVALTAVDVANFGIGEISVVNPNMAPATPLDLEVLANTPTIIYVSPSNIAAYTGSSVPQQVYIREPLTKIQFEQLSK